MSRWTRWMHRRNLRGEPLTLLVDDRYPGETLEVLAHAIYRYRSELVPLVLGAATGLAAAFLHSRFPGWAPVISLLTLVGSAALWWVERLTSGLGKIKRVYAVTGAAGLWLAATTAVGNGTVPLPALLAPAMPWWRRRRRRARVRVERTLQTWPDIAECAGLTGSRVMSAGRRPVTADGQLAISEYHRCCRHESRAETRGGGGPR